MQIQMGIKGRFEDIQGNLIIAINDGNRETHDLTANVELDDNYRVIHNETGKSLFFKDIIPPIYHIRSGICTYIHEWYPVDGLYLISGDTYEYKIITEESEYITTYLYTGTDMSPNFSYPGKNDIDYDSIVSKISDEQLTETKSKYSDLGYDEQISFLEGDISCPFEPNIYGYNPIIFSSVPNDERGSTNDTPTSVSPDCPQGYAYKTGFEEPPETDLMYKETNLHVVNFTKLSCLVTYNNRRGNKSSIIEAFQHQPPQDLDYEVGKFLERLLDLRMMYYRQGRVDEYNQIKSGG